MSACWKLCEETCTSAISRASPREFPPGFSPIQVWERRIRLENLVGCPARMAYLYFLAVFVGIPTLFFALLNATLRRLGFELPSSLQAWPALTVVGGHVLLALVYTTPWDNYLVATRVWWYNPDLVLGFTFGYVPFEEYLFFVGQTVLLGLALLAAGRLFPNPALSFRPRPFLRMGSAGLALVAWLFGLLLLLWDHLPGTYMGLELVWGMIPILIQFAFGADILWHHWRPVLWTLLPGTLYLAGADALAIRSGTWTIDPEQSLGVILGGILPLEEFVFFLLTSSMVVFGVTLVIAKESHVRARWFSGRLRSLP